MSFDLEEQRLKVQEYKNIPCPPSGNNNYALKHLRDTAISALEPVCAAAAMSAIPDEQQAKLKRNLVILILIHLIIAERGRDFKGVAGPLERALIDQGQEALIDSINNLSAFNKRIGTITPKLLHDFLMKDGARKISKQLLEDIHTNQKPAANPAPEKDVQKDMSRSMKQ